MAHVDRVQRWDDGETNAPNEFSAELRSAVGEMNGHLDVDNLGHLSLDIDKFKLDAFNEILWRKSATPQVLTRDASDQSVWLVIDSVLVDVIDGALEIEAGIASLGVGGTAGTLGVGVRVDGRVVGRSDPENMNRDTTTLSVVEPVGAGTRLVEIVAQIDGTTATVEARRLWIRMVKR